MEVRAGEGRFLQFNRLQLSAITISRAILAARVLAAWGERAAMPLVDRSVGAKRMAEEGETQETAMPAQAEPFLLIRPQSTWTTIFS